MAKTTVSDTNCSSQYIVLIMDWIESGAHWVRGFKTLAEAQEASPIGQACELSPERIICTPTNRGRGNDNCVDKVIPATFEPAYLRGDTNLSGSVTAEDGKVAHLYYKFDKRNPIECQAILDVAGKLAGNYQFDSFWTSNDLVTMNELKHGSLNFVPTLICASQCEIINHMSPSNK